MREIKFRAWDKESKEMFNIFDGSHDNWFLPSWKDKYNVMQYTGLKDKDGAEIYEGDIIKNASGEDFDIISIIEFSKGTFCLKEKGNQQYDYIENPLYEWNCECEVIGNIYENKELLEKI